ncbi:XRE family transcriptional regulator [Aureimonas fodinaquatilis]|uniref:XRE family transcriptional regulator n=1 Tax=Aureimonas fodinaquatilis TaxID=2565783 RepID=A0A5B0DWN4_9HYPH|nr:XRE family transcriptional regulator [Aureimonas fodinaquatilis]
MTSQEFKAWRSALSLSKKEAAMALGLSIPSIYNYELGYRREDGRPVIIPRPVALACAALANGLEPWRAVA